MMMIQIPSQQILLLLLFLQLFISKGNSFVFSSPSSPTIRKTIIIQSEASSSSLEGSEDIPSTVFTSSLSDSSDDDDYVSNSLNIVRNGDNVSRREVSFNAGDVSNGVGLEEVYNNKVLFEEQVKSIEADRLDDDDSRTINDVQSVKGVVWSASDTSPMFVQRYSDAADDCMNYLLDNLMIYDELNAGTLGFPVRGLESSSSPDYGNMLAEVERKLSIGLLDLYDAFTSSLPDGLSNGIVGPTIQLALKTKEYPWARQVPREIFMEYVLNFANLNEARTNWRPIFAEALQPLVETLLEETSTTTTEELTVNDVTMAVNQYIWSAFDSDDSISFKAGQTPLVFDPMSILFTKYASCTGLSIILVNALRAVGIPARIAGTPAWNGNADNGNHTWVEVWSAQHGWRFTEAFPAAGFVGSLDAPCDYWFCNKEKFDGKTQVYAARLDKTASTWFPLAWDIQNNGIPGEPRSYEMTEIIDSQCLT